MRKLLKEPLIQFLILGGILFAVRGLTQARPDSETQRVTVTPAQIEQLMAGFRLTWQRPPTEDELARLVESFIREEIYYREALALGFDRDDPIIRRRLRQKVEFLSDDLADAVQPTRAELQTFLDENPELFRQEPRVSFEQVYFSRDRRGADAERDARAVLARADESFDPMSEGDPFVLPNAFEDLTTTQIANSFGTEFAQAVVELDPGSWQGPVSSGYGVHLVRVLERTAGRIPPLDEIEPTVSREFLARRRQETNAAVYRALRERYSVSVDWPEGIQAIPLDGVERPGG